MKRCALLVTLLLTVLSYLHAQTEYCGSSLRHLSAGQLADRPDFSDRAFFARPKKLGQVDTVAVTIHLVQTDELTSSLRMEAIDREMATINAAFSDAGLAFLRCGPIRKIRGEAAYNFTTGDQLNRENHVPNTVNIYFAEWLQTDIGFPICGYSSFPWMDQPADRYIMMANPCLDNGVTLTHELGHFYGLYHTHETYFGAEFVDGSNCHSAGDQICDTPADPNLGRSFIAGNCIYRDNQKDAKGQTYQPPVSNYMSYAPSQCRWQFTEQQNALMRSVHENENAYLYANCDFYPDFAISFDIGSSVIIRSGDPILAAYSFQNVGIRQNYDLDLHFYISEEPGVTSTPIHRETLSIRPGDQVLRRNFSIDFPGNQGSGQYYLTARIDAYDRVVERQEENNFAALPVKVDNSALADLRLFPNPVREEVRFFLRDAGLRGRLLPRILRYDGRLVRELPVLYKDDEEILGRFPVADLSAGLYLLSVGDEDGKNFYTVRFWKE